LEHADGTFVASFSADGAHLWSSSIGGGDFMGVTSGVSESENGDVVVMGWFIGTAISPSDQLVSAGATDIFFARFSSTGDFVDATRMGGEGYDYLYGMARAQDNSVAVTGSFQGEISVGDTQITSAGDSDIFLMAVSSDWSVQWLRQLGGLGADHGYGLAMDDDGNIIMTGLFEDLVDFGDGPMAAVGLADVFVTKYSSSGIPLWSLVFGSEQSDEGDLVVIDDSENILVGGRFDAAMVVGPTTHEGPGLFLVKLVP